MDPGDHFTTFFTKSRPASGDKNLEKFQFQIIQNRLTGPLQTLYDGKTSWRNLIDIFIVDLDSRLKVFYPKDFILGIKVQLDKTRQQPK